MPPLSYLALGDSYTIGECVPLSENFPNQVVRLLNEHALSFGPPTIIAKTGWTTGELLDAIARTSDIAASYDIVSLLIGVNNQYRGDDINQYEKQFEELLNLAIGFANNQPNRVFVFSIPDWSVTPYATSRNREAISQQINLFNAVNRKVAQNRNVHYLEITQGTRLVKEDLSLIAEDGLHPSSAEYRRWAEKFAQAIGLELK